MRIHPAITTRPSRRNRGWWLLIVVCWLWAGSTIKAANFVTRVWLRENGLPQNTVTALLQTHDGYLWIGTYNGLARFDGVRFECFDSGNLPELGDSRVTSLFEDRDGTLWIGHETGELTSYQHGHFKSEGANLHELKRKIMDIGTDESGDLWLFYEDGILARLRDGRQLTPEAGLHLNLVEMTRSESGTIWISRLGRVSVLQAGKLTPLNFAAGNTNRTVSAIGASRDGGLWMKVAGRVQKWQNGAWAKDLGPAPFASSPLLKLVESRNGTLLGTTSDHGLALISPDGKVSQFNRTTAFPSDWVTAVVEDREGNFWAGTGGNGLAMIRESNVQTIAPPDDWQGRAILSVCFDHENTMWAGTEGAGLYRYQDGSWTNFATEAGLANPYIWSLAEDTSGNLWAGTWGAGLYMRQGDHFEIPAGLTGINTPMPALFPSAQGGLWIGTGDGLLRFETNGHRSWPGQTGIPAKRDVRCVLESRAGAVWYGTAGEGLFCLDSGRLTQFRKADGLPGDFVHCLKEDESGTLWIGTSDGLGRYADHHFTALTTKQGLLDNVICDLEDDHHGFFWISSYNGIFRVNQSELQQCADGRAPLVHCLGFGIGDGLPTLEATSGGCRTPDGKLWFPTCRGLVVLDPEDAKTNALPPPVLIEGLLVDNQMVAGSSSPLDLRIPPGRHRFEFQYTGLSFTAPEKVRFKHRLDNLDADWIAAGSQRAADYPYIPPGHYQFHVIACNNLGVWNEEGAALSFTVLPYFWQTLWFNAVALTAIIAFTGAGAWYSTRRRMRRRLEFLERQRAIERERTRIAKDIHDDLGASLTRINLLSQSARREMADPPQTQKNLDQICVTARQLTRAMDEIVWAVDPQHDTLDSLASYLGKLIHELMADSGIRCRLDFPVYLPAWPVTAEVRHNLFLACKEALHNVLKHSAATEVRIIFALETNGFSINITDNGRGFDPATHAASTRPRRNGLVNMSHRLEEIGGRCEIRSQIGGGTAITFFLPAKITTS